MMTRASIRFAATALALFLTAPPNLRADDPGTIGAGSPFGKGLDEQKIRDDFAKLRQQIEQSQEAVRRPTKDSKFHRWSASGKKDSVREKNYIHRNLSDPRERHDARRDPQRDRQDFHRESTQRKSNSSSSPGSGSEHHAS
jgi:hypothetical protein